MKNLFLKIMVLTSFLSFFGCTNPTDPSTWSDKKIDKWFEKREWLHGWTVLPDASIDRRAFAVSYLKNKDRWDKAFAFLKDSDLQKIELKRYDIDGENLYATIGENLTHDLEGAKYEAHRKYIDIQYVVSGKEQMGLAPLSSKKEAVSQFDTEKDYELMTVTQGKNLLATPERFFIFFPSDAHSPGLKDGEKSQVRKVVVKLKVD
jgi:biofilm protein TabA